VGSFAVFGRVLDRMLKMAYVLILCIVDIFGFIFLCEGSAQGVLDILYDADYLHTVITNRISFVYIQ